MHPKILKENIIYTNQFVSIYNNDLTTARNTEFTDQNQPVKYKGTNNQRVVVIPVTTDNKIVLTKEFYPEINEHLFVLPNDAVAEKNIESAAQRKLKDDTGFTTNSLQYVQRIIKIPKNSDRCNHTFIAHHSKYTSPLNLDPNDNIKGGHHFDLDQIKKMCENGSIIDTVSLIAINVYIESLK